ncbi:alkane 1-monooxygenase [Oceanicoccus sp. KOV_DT_Chl]|uniref:alkane 1-monooxygenase n=1 Tax=Oceanicoccus sp. KOV_DT_Chl TaxID=1904639 RepID=UPI000C7A30CC|nr:alkane 1-monooxygenase [Oceanicoccus sp. KOV_DT_Chl]
MTTANALIQKRPLWLLSLLMPTLPFVSYALVTASGNPLFWWLSVIYATLLIPLLDFLLGENSINPSDEVNASLVNDVFYQRIVYCYPLLQWLALGFGVWVAASALLHGWDWLAWALTFGAINGYGINAAHELGHKRGKLGQWLAKITLMPSFYGHFLVEHNRGHHVKVATPEDPASAKLGESFWRFLPRTIFGSLRSAWQLEKQKLNRQQRSVWHWRNENLQGWAGSLLILLLALGVGGWWTALWFLAQAWQAISLLEVINYIEHYGLKRQRLDNGRYEKCSPLHSWNSNTVYSNITLFQLQRHSDHHANPTRPYQLLRHFDQSPQLPSGYAAMILLAYIPALWFRVMDKRVLAHYDGDRSLANEYLKNDGYKLPDKNGIFAMTRQGMDLLRQQWQMLKG